jgi:hypothetical protein
MGPESPQHIAAGMAATNLVIISQILTRDSISCLLFVSVAVFAVTLPLNVYFYILDDDFVAAQHGSGSARINILFARFMGLLGLNIAGFILVFFHFGILPGALFLLTSVLLFRAILTGAERGATWRTLRRVVTSLFRRLPSTEPANQ